MTANEFRIECIGILGEHRADDCMEWSIAYLLATLRHHGIDGEQLRQRALEAGL